MTEQRQKGTVMSAHKDNKVREWLKQNLVFFQITSWVVLGVMSVIISFSALQISCQQKEMNYLEHAPQIRISHNYEINQETGYAEGDIIQIYNDGFRLRNFTSEVIVLLKVNRLINDNYESVYAPFIFYYATTHEGSTTGLLVTHMGYKNNSKYMTLFHSLMDLEQSDDENTYDLTMMPFIRVQYEDYTGKTHVEYFSIFGYRVLGPLPSEEGEAWFRFYDELFLDVFLDIDDVTIDDVLALFNSEAAMRIPPN